MYLFWNFWCLQSSKLGCGCGGDKCNPSQCDHVMMFDNDNDGARDKSGVAMKCRFPYDEQGRIILEVGHNLSFQICAHVFDYDSLASKRLETSKP